ncbi:hypothetical protein HPB47_008443, partial [Ixodes persulcatus]
MTSPESSANSASREDTAMPLDRSDVNVRNPVEKQTVSPGLVLYFNERWSYAQLLELSSRVAAGLQKLGFKPGQLAGLHCDATPNIVFAFYGTVLTGGSMVFAKSSLTERELTYQFGDSRPSLVFCDEANADKTKSACATISSVE